MLEPNAGKAHIMSCPYRSRVLGNHVGMWKAAFLPLVHIWRIVGRHALDGRAEVTSYQVGVNRLPGCLKHPWNSMNRRGPAQSRHCGVCS
jgi:hypothetical protein